MAQMNANTIKTYDPFEMSAAGMALMDSIHAAGMKVIITVLSANSQLNSNYLAAVDYFKNHPAVLMWAVGNEINLNTLYGAPSLTSAINSVRTIVGEIHARDPHHPVAVSWGDIPSQQEYTALSAADLWLLNLYPELDIQNKFIEWRMFSPKPILIGEYGADAYNMMTGQEDQASQAQATQTLTEQILGWASAGNPSLPVVGGCIYSLTDEWWKSAGGSASTQETGGFEINIFPDGFANEEWWGLLNINRQPRQAYTVLQTLYGAD
jgi:hypothetical protein